MWKLLFRLVKTMPLCLCLLACSTSSPLKENDEKIFREKYPELNDRIENLKVYIDTSQIREITSYYKFSISENEALTFLDRQRYVKFDTGISNKFPGSVEYIKCDALFMVLDSQFNNQPQWWDVNAVKDYSCFIVLPDRVHSQERVIYDRKKKILYMYIHHA